jgi:hypothetical protein
MRRDPGVATLREDRDRHAFSVPLTRVPDQPRRDHEMRDEQGRRKQGEDVPRHSEVKSRKLDPATLDKVVDEIRDAFQAEDPDHSGRKSAPGLQRHDREQRKPGGDEIAISGRHRKVPREAGIDHGRNEHGETQGAREVKQQQWYERIRE